MMVDKIKKSNSRELFNELEMLDRIYLAWGEASGPHITPDAMDALMNALTIHPEKYTYTALDVGPRLKMEKIGPKAFGFKKAAELMLKRIKQAEFNMSIVLPFMKAGAAKKYMPPVENADILHKLSEKYDLKILQTLLPAVKLCP